ncbi:MAG TPA: GntR family transcriptional regulator [Steroidobacteraceae bacterium]|nr:GntR family transcriptional regulator [Steroidobacteraceae bacterium]
MDLNIDVKDGVPIYRQIANQIRYMAASGLLQPDEELPAIRVLAAQLRVTPNTVVKAYEELESAGVISKRRGSGCYISDGPSKLAEREKRRILEQRIDGLLAEARQLNYRTGDLLKLIHRRLALLDNLTGRSANGDGP